MNKQQIWNSRFFKYHLIHFCHSARVSPETIVNGRKSDAFSLAIERRKHHVARVQGVNKVWWECVALFNRIRSTVNINCYNFWELFKKIPNLPCFVVRIIVVRLHNW